MAAQGIRLNHIARETADVNRLAAFYQDVLGFSRIETPNFGDFEVVWLQLPPFFSLHLIERNPQSKLPEGPYSSAAAVADPKGLARGHHLAFSVSNYDEFVKGLKERGLEVSEKTQPDGKTRQVFFFDPDGNGLEVTTVSNSIEGGEAQCWSRGWHYHRRGVSTKPLRHDESYDNAEVRDNHEHSKFRNWSKSRQCGKGKYLNRGKPDDPDCND